MTHWTPQEDAALRRILPTCSTLREVGRRLAEIIGRQIREESIRDRCNRLGLRSLLASGLYGNEDAEPNEPIDAPAAPIERPSSKRVSTLDDDRLKVLIDFTRRQPRTFEEVCDELDLPPYKSRELIEQAGIDGYRIEIVGEHVGARPASSPLEEQLIVVDQANDWQKFAAVGDVHVGSKYFMKAQFLDFVGGAYEEGVRVFLQGGDLLDGVYRHSIWDQSQRGFEEQVAEAIDVIPRLEGATWHFIQGNHDETFGEQSGIDVGKAIVQAFRAAGRHDLVYHGARGAYVRLKGPSDTRGLLVEMWHPRDRANAYALSYRAQKHIEKYPPGAKPDCLLAFHWHQTFYFETRGVHAMSCGCWQGGQSSFGKSLGGAPSIGSWIVDYALTDGGTVRRWRPEWKGYQEVETVRDVNLG